MPGKKWPGALRHAAGPSSRGEIRHGYTLIERHWLKGGNGEVEPTSPARS
jgi:hypothetical protein